MSDPPGHRPVIQFKNVFLRLESGLELLHNLSLEIERGETLVLLGRSGSGKTTTLKLINHLLSATSGEILVDGRSLGDWDLIRLRRMMGYVIQEVGLFPQFSLPTGTFRRSAATGGSCPRSCGRSTYSLDGRAFRRARPHHPR